MNRKPGDDVRNRDRRHPLVALLATERIVLGIPQSVVAAASGLNRNTLSTIETGKRGSSLHTFEAYARGMGYALQLIPIKGRRNVSKIHCPNCGTSLDPGNLGSHMMTNHPEAVYPAKAPKERK